MQPDVSKAAYFTPASRGRNGSGPIAPAGASIHGAKGQSDQATQPIDQVSSTTRPKAMRYQANGTKLWCAM